MLGEHLTRFIPRRTQEVDPRTEARRQEILAMAQEQESFSVNDAVDRLAKKKLTPGVANALVVHDIYALLGQKRLDIGLLPTSKGRLVVFTAIKPSLEVNQ